MKMARLNTPKHHKKTTLFGAVFTFIMAVTGVSVLVARNYNVRRKDVKDQIGKTAGAIYELLKREGTVSVTQVPKLINEKQPITYQALGWLAREDRIEYNTEKTKAVVSLKKVD